MRKIYVHYSFCQGLKLIPKLWRIIKEKAVGVVAKLETAALASYQIHLDVGASAVNDMFDKVAT
jgi:hypothetical protein